MATAPIFVPEIQRQPRLAASAAGRSQLREVLFEKAIDNSRLYREVDLERHRQCFALLGIIGLAFLFVFLFAWEQFRCVRYGYEIEHLKSQRAALAVWNERLHLEQALMADPQRIDRLARVHLGLTPARSGQIVQLDGAKGLLHQSNARVFARNFESVAPATRGNPREP